MSWHIGRSFPGMDKRLEEECPCPKEACGLVDVSRASQICTEHPVRRGKTIRQRHPSEQCPGAADA